MSYNIQADLILPKIKVTSQKQALTVLTQKIAAQIHYPQPLLFSHLMDREIQSSSGTGEGVAIPHLKLPNLQKRFVALATLSAPVDFKAVDGQPVDIICILLSPEQDGPLHLRGLSRISRLFKNKELCQKLRETGDEPVIQTLLGSPEGWLLAA